MLQRKKMITIVVGTNRENSMSTKIAHYYKSILEQYYTGPIDLVDLVELPANFTGTALYDNNGDNEKFNDLRERVQSADKLVFIVPEYNGSFPGVLKAFIDGFKYPQGVRDKKGALIGVSSGVQGGLIAMSHLTDIFNYLGMHVLAIKPKLAGIEKHWDGEKITNVLYNSLLHQQAEKLVKF